MTEAVSAILGFCMTRIWLLQWLRLEIKGTKDMLGDDRPALHAACA